MGTASFILALIALVIAIVAYRKTGGLADLKKHVDQTTSQIDLGKSVDSLAKAVDGIDKLEDVFRGKPEEKKKPVEEMPQERPEKQEQRTAPTAEVFQSELDRILASAQQEGRSFVEMTSGDLHRSVGGYPGRNHRMPLCCRVIRKNMKPGDETLQQPPSGQGATLTVRFQLPR